MMGDEAERKSQSPVFFPVNRPIFKTSEFAFPNANAFTGPFECNRLKIKSEVWNGTANLNLVCQYCIVAWMTDFF